MRQLRIPSAVNRQGLRVECGCSPNGTDPTSIGECEPFSGACTCKSNVLPGGKCDTCKVREGAL